MKAPKNKSLLEELEEKRRLEALLEFEVAAQQQGFRCIAGVDEAGRGPLAGPVVAAACILPPNLGLSGIDDSKRLTPSTRDHFFSILTQNPQVKFGIGLVSSAEIDHSNIYQATIMAMLQAVASLSSQPDFLLVDGLQLPHPTIPCQKIIQGDARSQSIAAASILAKVTRDRMMEKFDKQWPEYGFAQHKGYGTVRHREAIAQWGPCPIHRMTFEPLKTQSVAGPYSKSS